MLRDAVARFGDNTVLLYDLACFEALSGEPEEAFAHLSRSVELDPGMKTGAAADSDFDALRSDPRFEALVS